MWKIIKGIIALLVIGAIAFVVMAYLSLPESVETYKVERSTWERFFEEDGEIVEQEPTEVFAELSGSIEEAFFEDGDIVAEGDTLFVIDTMDYEALIAQYNNQLEALDGEQAQAETDFRREIKQIDIERHTIDVELETIQSRIPPIDVKIALQENSIGEIRKNYDDTVYLFESGLVSNKEVDTVRLELDAAEGVIDELKAEIDAMNEQTDVLRQQKTNLDEMAASLNIEGLISKIAAEKRIIQNNIAEANRRIDKSVIAANASGQLEEPIKTGQSVASGGLVATIRSTDELELECFVRLEDLGGIAVGQKAEATLVQNTGDITFDATITEIEPEAKEVPGLNTKRVRVVLLLAQNDIVQLRSGYELTVKFVTTFIENSMVIPKTAVIQDEDGNAAVWTVENDTAVKKPIEIQDQDFGNVLIKSGLSEGDVVVTTMEAITQEGQKLVLE